MGSSAKLKIVLRTSKSKISSKKETGGKVEDQIGLAFRYCFGRSPGADELEKGVSFVEQHGLPQFCRVLFNTNEFLFLP